MDNNVLEKLKNYSDISNEQNQAEIIAKMIVKKNECRMMPDDCMEIDDLFCFLLEILLHSIDEIDNTISIFDLDNIFNPIVYELKNIMHRLSYNLIINDEEDKNNYFYKIEQRPMVNTQTDWYVANKYKLVCNTNFDYKNKSLSDLKCIFTNIYNQTFSVCFSYHYSQNCTM